MAATLKCCVLLALVVVGSNAHGTFQTYNKEARERSERNIVTDSNVIEKTSFHVGVGKVKSGLKRAEYDPTWESLDARPLPSWYDQSKIGIFIHWGVFSVPGLLDEWFWWHWANGNQDAARFMQQNYKPGTTYQEFAHDFTAEFFNPDQWAELFKKAGAKYVVLTSKHHEGYTLWPSRLSFSWNAKDVGPHRDLLGDFATAIRNNTDIRFGLYHSLYEWYNPLWEQDARNEFRSDEFVRFKTLPELYELVNTYQPEIVWSDGDWDAPDTYWQSTEFLAWLYNDSPVKETVVTNDRWGDGTICTHGGYYTCTDRYNPGVLQPHKWENCFTIDKRSWGYRRNTNLDDYMTPNDIMRTIVETVSCGGNVLINVGPTREGTIPPIQEERLLQMGEWLEINGEAIYNSIPHTVQNDTLTPGVWYTTNEDKSKVYAMITNYPGESITLASAPRDTNQRVQLLGTDGTLTWTETAQGVQVTMPHPDQIKSKWVWTLVFNK